MRNQNIGRHNSVINKVPVSLSFPKASVMDTLNKMSRCTGCCNNTAVDSVQLVGFIVLLVTFCCVWFVSRHNTYLQECTGVRDLGYIFTLHDLKHLLMRFAQEASFSADSGGGGRQSNMHLAPYMLHLAVYVINTWVALQSSACLLSTLFIWQERNSIIYSLPRNFEVPSNCRVKISII